MSGSSLGDVTRIVGAPGTTLQIRCFDPVLADLSVDGGPRVVLGSTGQAGTDLTVASPWGMVIGSGDTASRPASPPVGTLRYNTDLGVVEVYKVSGWRLVAPQIEDPPPTGFAARTPTIRYDAGVPAGGVTVTGLSNHDWIVVWLSHTRINPNRDLDLLFYDSGGTQLTSVENVAATTRSDGTTVTWTRSTADRVRLLEDTYVDSRTEFSIRLEIHNGVSNTGQAVVVGHAAYDDPATGTFSWCEIFGRVGSATPVDRIQLSSTGSFASGHLFVYGV